MKKGFVGPLGDDIPSIFPIVAGILLFVSTVAYSLSFIQAKNEYLDTRKAALGLAYIATKKGLSTVFEFDDECTNTLRPYAGARGVKFAVVLKKFCRKIALNSYPFDWQTYPANPVTGEEEVGGGQTFEGAFCATEGITRTALADPENMPLAAVILTYPIAVKCPDEPSVTRGLGMINVMVWKKKGRLEEASGVS